MTEPEKKLNRLASQFDAGITDERKAESGAVFDAVDGLWSAVMSGPHLSPRMKELILLALHASPSALNERAVVRHIARAREAGASNNDIVDVLVTILPLANHPLYVGLPLLMDELSKAGMDDQAVVPPIRDDLCAMKEDYLRRRGGWTAMRDQIASWMPDYFAAFIKTCMAPWENGSLAPMERELLYIAIDCSVTHVHEAGMRMHIAAALRHGATRDQILEVFQLAALLGTESFVLGVAAMDGEQLCHRKNV